METVNEKVRNWRKTQKMTLKTAATVLELSPSYLSEIETGKRDFTSAVIRKYLAAAPDFFEANDFYQ